MKPAVPLGSCTVGTGNGGLRGEFLSIGPILMRVSENLPLPASRRCGPQELTSAPPGHCFSVAP